MRIAVIDVGTNSTRLYVADVEDDTIAAELDRQTTITRLGQGVDASGELHPDATARVDTAIKTYKNAIDALHVDATTAILTSAVRDARNGATFTQHLNDTYNINARTITGDEEARLTYLGATSDQHQPHQQHPQVVVDVGGGSTELVVGTGPDVTFHVSTQAGVVRQTERFLHTDPPAPAELQRLQEEAAAIFTGATPEPVRAGVTHGLAVAGTATSAAAILQELDPYDPARVHGFRLLAAQLDELLARLAQLTTDQRRHVTGLHPDRAEAIVAGVILLRQAMATFGLTEITVSEHDILRGAALDRAASPA